MLRLFHESLLAYANSWWGRRIFVWSSILIVIGVIVVAASMGIDGGAGSSAASSKFAMLVVVVLAVPVLIVCNLALALIFATGRTVLLLLRAS